MNRFTLFLILLALGFVWGFTIPLTKIAVSTGHHPFGLLFWQSLISVVVLFVILLIRKSHLVFDRSHLLFFTVISLSGTLVPNSISYWTAFHLPAGVIALIIALVPMFTFIVALVFKLEKFHLTRLFGILLGAFAIALIVLPKSSLPDQTKVIFILIGLISPFCYGVEANYLSIKQPADTGPIATLFGASLVGVIVITPLVLISDSFINPLDTMGKPEWALLMATILHITAYTGYIWLVGKAGPVFSSQIAYVVTPAGVLLSVVMLGETHSPYIWAALAILLVALMLVNPKNGAVQAK